MCIICGAESSRVSSSLPLPQLLTANWHCHNNVVAVAAIVVVTVAVCRSHFAANSCTQFGAKEVVSFKVPASPSLSLSISSQNANAKCQLRCLWCLYLSLSVCVRAVKCVCVFVENTHFNFLVTKISLNFNCFAAFCVCLKQRKKES